MFERLFTRDTTVNESVFRMRLPGTWRRTYSEAEGRWNFNTDLEQITVSVLGTAKRLVPEEQDELLKRMVLIRRRAELEVAPGVQLQEVVFATLGSELLARYEGSGPESDRFFTCLVMLNPTVLGTFYYESSGLTLDRFHERGRAAFNSIKLAQASDM